MGVLAAATGFLLRLFRGADLSPRLVKGLYLGITGAGFQLFAGPFDFWWHSNFGVNGLLSPPHLMLVLGMFLNASGAVTGLSLLVRRTESPNRSSLFLLAGLTALWMSSAGLVLMFTSPFSKGTRFDFNPDLSGRQ